MTTPPHRRGLRRHLALVLVLPMLLLAACGTQSDKDPTFALPSGLPTPNPAPTESATPSASASPSASAGPTKGSTVKGIDLYISQLPTFDAAPPPTAIDVSAGDKSPLWYQVPTTDKVAFLTIDDGALEHPAALPLLQASGVKVTLFLTYNFVKNKVAYFKKLQEAGAVIENHTISHKSLRGLSYAAQKAEICGAADKLGNLFGRRPKLFRPPFGNFDQTTLKAARDCGQIAVLHWRETVDKGIVRYQSSPHLVKPGHILLMHFRPAFADDFVGALKAMKKSGVQPALLEDYILGAS
ncbi:peptidoglycan/xylan/chitin deacetylase (PgdA/CDA1 family) [Allocatelliglobosispora scoriae]|uniref:Peptidoglycan/xylan/chitin deacetylase (PgdA/CDA1 family) n=1 Tax=Allocatelliglobosispora scoriae TaxID=643052 RepID=A0A841BVE7_9ACTN|nr:polysaccharide deacetylase family protein [Allocatelliglobosispora scoriae]MBB5870740.1 peptidoglycan/xylan/chitin deacetylase (PgdA/CDA1 family) [Allocatelliglobosispora scoriae]